MFKIGYVMFNGLGKMLKKEKNRMNFTRTLVLGTIFAAACSVSIGATYYVNPTTGLDTNTGASATPFKTVSKATTVATYGDTIILKAGNYGKLYLGGTTYTGAMDQKLPADTKWITIKSEQPGAAIFSAPGAEYAIEFGKYDRNLYLAYVFDGIKAKGKVFINKVIGLKFINSEITGNSDLISQAAGGFGLRSSCDITIENSKIHSVNKNAIDGASTCLSIIDNEIYNVGSDHIFLSGSNNILIEGNHIHHTNWWDSTAHPDAIQLYYGPFNNIFIRNNIMHDFAVQGIFCSGAPTLITNLVIENNLMYNVETSSITYGNVTGGKIANNTIIGTVFIGDNVTGLSVYNNLFAGSYYANATHMFTYRDYNIYIKGSGGGGYYNIGDSEPHSLGYANGYTPVQLGIFKDALNNDFTLASNSKAINFGTSLNAATIDLLGYIRDVTPDAGCYEYTSGTTIPEPNVITVPKVELLIAPIDAKTVTEGQALGFDVVVTGAAANLITCTAEGLPVGATFTNKRFQWTPKSGQAGLYFLKINATCGDANTTRYVAVTVQQNTSYHTPTFGVFLGTSVFEAEQLSVVVSATDPDGDKLRIEAINLPVGAIFYDNKLIWVPDYGTAGTYKVQFTASDGINSASTEVSIIIKKAATETYPGKRLIYYWQTTLSLLGKI